MKIVDSTNWRVITQEQIEGIMARLNELYHDLPLEYAGLALSAMNDIEDIIYKGPKNG